MNPFDEIVVLGNATDETMGVSGNYTDPSAPFTGECNSKVTQRQC